MARAAQPALEAPAAAREPITVAELAVRRELIAARAPAAVPPLLALLALLEVPAERKPGPRGAKAPELPVRLEPRNWPFLL